MTINHASTLLHHKFKLSAQAQASSITLFNQLYMAEELRQHVRENVDHWSYTVEEQRTDRHGSCGTRESCDGVLTISTPKVGSSQSNSSSGQARASSSMVNQLLSNSRALTSARLPWLLEAVQERWIFFCLTSVGMPSSPIGGDVLYFDGSL